MTTAELSLATIHEFAGREIGVSGWMLIDQQRIDAFAECTGDYQWIHVDAERARRESPWGTTVAHGYLTLSLLAKATFETLLEPAGITQAFNYGLDRVRFIAPVKAGSRIRNRLVLLSVEDKGAGRLLLTTENTVQIEGEDKPALIANAIIMAAGGPRTA